MKFTI